MPQTLRIGKLLGIPIGIHVSWFLVFGLVTWNLGAEYFPHVYRNWSAELSWGLGVITSLLFFASVVAHELAHSLVARRYGIPVLSITLFLFGGVARIGREASRPAVELQVAVAGPATSFILAGLFWVAASNIGAASEPVTAVAAYLAYVNGTLGVFNLIPGFPLDGGRAFRAILWLLKPDYRLATRIATRAGKLIAYLFTAIGIFASLSGFLANGVMLVIIGWFLHSAAGMSQSQVEAQESLHGIRIGELGAGSVHTVAPNLTLQQLVDEHLTAHRGRLLPVVQDGILLGLIGSRQVRRIPQRLWGITQVAGAMLPRDRVATLEPEVTASEALAAVGERGLGYILVAQGDRFIGLVTVDDLMELARARHKLGL